LPKTRVGSVASHADPLRRLCSCPEPRRPFRRRRRLHRCDD
jgi:hypothetical protein